MPEDSAPISIDEEQCKEGSECVSRAGIIAMIGTNAVLLVIVIYVLAKLWPYPTPSFLPPGTNRPNANAATAPAATPAPDANPAGQAATAPDAAATDTAAQRRQADSLQRIAEQRRADSLASLNLRTADSLIIPIWLKCDTSLLETYRHISAQRPPDYSAIPKCVYLFTRDVAIWDEQRLLFMVLLAGALGALVHTLRSLSIYIGNRKLRRSWVPYYLLMPFGGAAIALIFYLVIRGGFFAPSTDFKDTNAFAFTALAALVGLFSQSAIEKLKRIAETIFERPEPQKDSLKDKPPARTPVITAVERKAVVEGGREDTVQITGSEFTASSKVEINGKPHLAVFEGPTLLTVTLEAPELAILENGGDLRIVVINDDQRSNELVLS